VSEPEIARRCPHCGISLRERAFFCPQCGKEIEEPPETEEAPSSPGFDQPTLTERDTLAWDAGAAKATTQDIHPKSQLKKPGSGKTKQKKSVARVSNSPQMPNREPARKDGAGSQSERKNRAVSATRGVIEDNVLQRVEKLRKVSSVVIDEAAYDPSLRFVLVAALLFLMFLVIVIVSKVIG
jgi:hypothetical protein